MLYFLSHKKLAKLYNNLIFTYVFSELCFSTTAQFTVLWLQTDLICEIYQLLLPLLSPQERKLLNIKNVLACKKQQRQ